MYIHYWRIWNSDYHANNYKYIAIETWQLLLVKNKKNKKNIVKKAKKNEWRYSGPLEIAIRITKNLIIDHTNQNYEYKDYKNIIHSVSPSVQICTFKFSTYNLVFEKNIKLITLYLTDIKTTNR